MSTADVQRDLYEQYMESQAWDDAQVEAHQRRILTKLVHHARENVPFYARRLDAVVRPDGGIDWDRWPEVPILKRSDMLESRPQMQAARMPRGSGPVGLVTTSGTTGRPITLSVNAYSAVINNALRWRLHRWHGLDWSRPLCLRRGDDPAVAAYPDGQLLGPWGPTFVARARKGEAWEINRFASIEANGHFLNHRRAAYYMTGPNIAYSLATTAQVMGLEVKLDAILAQGQRVTNADRAICRRVFGARIIEHYSSKEAGQIASECPEGRLHVNAEQVHVEIVDRNSRPCALGVPGRLLVTPLFSTAQPLIRYDQGDIAAFAPPCPCGRHGPILAPVQGRMTAIFRHPDGRVIASLMPDSYRDLLRADVWQIAQVGPNTYEVRYVPQSWDDPGDDAAFIAKFRAFYFSDAEVVTRRVREFAPPPSGKHLEYVNEYWTPPAT